MPSSITIPPVFSSSRSHAVLDDPLPQESAPRVLVLTAAFGEGHHSAARNIGLALKAAGASVRVCDPCLQSSPRSTRLLAAGYLMLTTHFPQVWKWIYRLTDQTDFSRPHLPLMAGPERFLRALIDDFQPDLIVSTYPIYPYFIARMPHSSAPVITIVTDSIKINSAWLRAPGGFWMVTDQETKKAMMNAGLAPARIVATGFPVHPDFAKLRPIRHDDPCSCFRILFFPTSRTRLRKHCRALLAASPSVKITLVMGKKSRRFKSAALRIQSECPGRVRIIGWSTRIPTLLNRHHLVVGKAGGATVHEAIAAHCPMLIDHLVPGQEEGNLQLLRSIGSGELCDSAARLSTTLKDLLASDAAAWRKMKGCVQAHNQSSGAIEGAAFILFALPQRPATRG